MFIPRRPEGCRKSSSQVVQLILFPLNSCRKRLGVSNLLRVRVLFDIFKMFYPPKGLCKAEPTGVHFIVFREGCVTKCDTFNLLNVFCLFENLEILYLRIDRWMVGWKDGWTECVLQFS